MQAATVPVVGHLFKMLSFRAIMPPDKVRIILDPRSKIAHTKYMTTSGVKATTVSEERAFFLTIIGSAKKDMNLSKSLRFSSI